MARGKPLTGFLLALVHSPEMTAAFNDPDERPALLEKWGLGNHELFSSGDLTLERVRAAVIAEHRNDAPSGSEGEGEGGIAFGSESENEPAGPTVSVAWWIWFFGGPK